MVTSGHCGQNAHGQAAGLPCERLQLDTSRRPPPVWLLFVVSYPEKARFDTNLNIL